MPDLDGEGFFEGIIEAHAGFFVAVIENTRQSYVRFSRGTPKEQLVGRIERAEILATCPAEIDNRSVLRTATEFIGGIRCELISLGKAEAEGDYRGLTLRRFPPVFRYREDQEEGDGACSQNSEKHLRFQENSSVPKIFYRCACQESLK